MKPIDPEDPTAKSEDIAGESRKKLVGVLRDLFPETVSEGEVDLDVLRQLLGGPAPEREERFGLNWHGKAQARSRALSASRGTLLPCPEDSVDWDSTRNLIIEGDNLEVLKLLQRSYAGKVKLIYIDPPYNTGKDFIYPDNFRDSIAGYLRVTGQVDGNGDKFSSNPEASGRFHSDWLSMIYPRLVLAHSFLRTDGIIVVSISDAEFHNLRCVMDEIFGGENLMGCVVWNPAKSFGNTDLVSVSHSYNLVYARNRDYFVKNRTHFRLPESGEGFRNPDNDPRGPWKADPFQVGGERPNQMYPITNPKTGEVFRPNPGNSWKNEKKVFDKLMAEGRIVFGIKGESEPRRKRFRSEAMERGRVAKTWWDDVGTSLHAMKETKKLMGASVFSSPKPVSLIRRFIQLATHDPDGAIVLDFFAGSGTVGQAVLEQNASDGGSRRYILVQLPEKLSNGDKEQKLGAEFCDSIGKSRNLAELTKERLRRAGRKVVTENPDFDGDVGFRALRLDRSCVKEWDPSPDDLERSLLDHVDNIREGRSEQDIFCELLLKRGFDLSSPTETRKIAGKLAFATDDRRLIALLAPEVGENEIEEIALGIADWAEESDRATDVNVVFRDTAFESDVAKANAVEILAQRGIKQVRSL